MKKAFVLVLLLALCPLAAMAATGSPATAPHLVPAAVMSQILGAQSAASAAPVAAPTAATAPWLGTAPAPAAVCCTLQDLRACKAACHASGCFGSTSCVDGLCQCDCICN